MKIIATLLMVGLLTGAAHAQSMQVEPAGARPTMIGSEANFTGSVTVDMLYSNDEHTGNSGGLVTFQPGARSAWHSHPAGQILIVTSGVGWAQEEGEGKIAIRPGDVIWTPPGVRHWHGATDKNGVSHIAVTNVKDGKNAIWMENVTDEQYLD